MRPSGISVAIFRGCWERARPITIINNGKSIKRRQMLFAIKHEKGASRLAVPYGYQSEGRGRMTETAYYELSVDIAAVSLSVYGEENETPSTLWTRSKGCKKGVGDAFRVFKGLISGFKNEALAGISYNVLSLLTNPNRGLNVFLRDVTVAIGGF